MEGAEMAKRTLEEGWVLDGVIYGPGEHDLPKEVDDALKAKGAFKGDDTDPVAAAIAAQGAQEGVDGGAVGTETTPVTTKTTGKSGGDAATNTSNPPE